MDWSKLVSLIQPATLLSTVVGLVWWIMKKAFARAAEELKGVKDQLSEIQQVTKVRAENHLCTIQANTTRHTELLEEMIKEQATTNGYLKAVVEVAKK